MHGGVGDQVGDDLAERAGVALHPDVVRNVQAQLGHAVAERRAEGEGDFMHHLVEAEFPALRGGLVGGHLLEAGDQFGRSLQVAFGNQRAGVHRFDEAVEQGAFQPFCTALAETPQGAAHGADGHYPVADRRVQFVGHAGDQGTQRGELFRAHQLALGELQVLDGGRQLGVGLAQLLGTLLHAVFEFDVQFAHFMFDAAEFGDVLGRPDGPRAAAEVDLARLDHAQECAAVLAHAPGLALGQRALLQLLDHLLAIGGIPPQSQFAARLAQHFLARVAKQLQHALIGLGEGKAGRGLGQQQADRRRFEDDLQFPLPLTDRLCHVLDVGGQLVQFDDRTARPVAARLALRQLPRPFGDGIDRAGGAGRPQRREEQAEQGQGNQRGDPEVHRSLQLGRIQPGRAAHDEVPVHAPGARGRHVVGLALEGSGADRRLPALSLGEDRLAGQVDHAHPGAVLGVGNDVAVAVGDPDRPGRRVARLGNGFQDVGQRNLADQHIAAGPRADRHGQPPGHRRQVLVAPYRVQLLHDGTAQTVVAEVVADQFADLLAAVAGDRRLGNAPIGSEVVDRGKGTLADQLLQLSLARPAGTVGHGPGDEFQLPLQDRQHCLRTTRQVAALGAQVAARLGGQARLVIGQQQGEGDQQRNRRGGREKEGERGAEMPARGHHGCWRTKRPFWMMAMAALRCVSP